jgi:hypothetical protein
MTQMPGLKIFFSTFSVKVLKRFFTSHAISIVDQIGWDKAKTKGELVDDIYDKVSALQAGNPDLFHKLYPVLADINMLSSNQKDWKSYYNRIRSDGKIKAFGEFFGGSAKVLLGDMVMWMKVEMPIAFDDFLSFKLANKKSISGGYRYYLPLTYCGKINPVENFREELKRYFKPEFGFDKRVHIERNDLPDCIRYVITTDPFPANEPQFKDDGNLGVGERKSAEMFYITLFEKTPRRDAQFVMRCDFTKTQRDTVAELFAKHVLDTRTGVRIQQERKLDRFRTRPENFDFKAAEPDFRHMEYVGVRMEIFSGDAKPEIYMRKFNGNFYEEIAKRGELKDVPLENMKIKELYLEITILKGEPPSLVQTNFMDPNGKDDPRKEHTYSVVVPSHGTWKVEAGSLSRVDEIKIDRILNAMDLRNVGGDKILNTKTRK